MNSGRRLVHTNVQVMDHPLIQHKVTLMRMKETGSKDFRQLLEEITMLMGYEITRDLPVQNVEIETPITKTTGKQLSGNQIAIVPVLRAGLGMLQGMQNLIPTVRVGFIGLYRDPETLKPVEYYCKLPPVEDRDFIVVDPMLATGGSFDAAITLLKEKGFKDISCMVLVAAPEGVEMLGKRHPDVMLYTASLDRELNANAYILPGLGDAGDRIFGTL